MAPLLESESPPLAKMQSYLVWFSGATLPESVPRECAFTVRALFKTSEVGFPSAGLEAVLGTTRDQNNVLSFIFGMLDIKADGLVKGVSESEWEALCTHCSTYRLPL